jgi:hypothetical protein
VTNCAGAGDALQLNQAALVTFLSGSYSTATNGVHITNGYTYGSSFKGADIENVSYCVRQDTAHAQYNTFEGGTLVWSTHAVSSTLSGTGGITFDRVNFGTTQLYGKNSTAIDPIGAVGVRVLGNYGDGSSPAVPQSGFATQNNTGQAQLVTLWANPGDLTAVTINGTQTMEVAAGITGFTVQLRPGYTITLTGTASWVWYPLDS